MPQSRAQQLSRLKVLLPIWQARLGLRDWTIVLKVVSPHELKTGMDSAGEITIFSDKRAARIQIVDVNELPPAEYAFEGNQERTLVHELTHLHVLPLEKLKPGSKAWGVAEEQAIHAISMALVTLATPTQKRTKR